MADVKISQLPVATTPLDGTELAPIVQSGTTKRVSVANLTVGRALTASSLTLTTPLSAADGGTGLTSLGTGVATALGVNTGSAGAFVVNGGALGTPSSGTLTNATGLPISTGVSGLGTGVATFLATPTSANLAAAVTDETGTGALVFSSSPTIATPTISTSFTSPLHIGGTTASSTLTLQSTSGVGTSDSIVFKVGNNGATTAATFDTSGNLGIGTTSPSYRLHVGNSSLTSTSPFANIISTFRSNASNADVCIQFSDGTAYDSRFGQIGGTAGAFGFFVGGTERARISSDGTFRVRGAGTAGSTDAFLVDGGAPASAARIDSSGNLLVGTTSAGIGKLCVYTSSNTVASADFRSTASGDVGNTSIYISKFDNNATTSQIFIQFAINNATVGSGQINANGANAAAFGSYSDIRLKENITPLPCQLSKILALKPSEFDYRDGSGHQIGFIAQEMQEVYPDVVGEGNDGMLTITGWSKTEARLVSAIQELAAKVSALEARI